jgi:hypothetical protein
MPASAFSASQRKQPATKRRCAECLEFNRQPKTAQKRAVAPPPAAPALPALDPPAAPNAWVPGTAWPHATTLFGMPPLYPGPALWVRDIPAFFASLPPELQELRCIPQCMLEEYANQVELDERYALLQWAYDQLPGGAKAPRMHAEHVAIFAASGLKLHARNRPYAFEAIELLRERESFEVEHGRQALCRCAALLRQMQAPHRRTLPLR